MERGKGYQYLIAATFIVGRVGSVVYIYRHMCTAARERLD